MNQKECINLKFSGGLGIFDNYYGYPEINEQEKYNGPTGKVVDIQGIRAHTGKLQEKNKIRSTYIFDGAIRVSLASAAATTETDQHRVQVPTFINHKLPAVGVTIRLHSSNDKEASNQCLT